jgi:hypothetical protein
MLLQLCFNSAVITIINKWSTVYLGCSSSSSSSSLFTLQFLSTFVNEHSYFYSGQSFTRNCQNTVTLYAHIRRIDMIF